MLFGSEQHILHDRQIVRVLSPAGNGDAVALEGAVRLVSTSVVEIHFPPDSLPSAVAERQGEWLILWEKGDSVLSARARLDSLLAEGAIRLEITGLFFQPSERRFSRVDAEVYLKYWPARSPEQEPRRANRQKINLSGCGLRFTSDEPYAPGDQIGLELSLPGPTLEVVRCLGCVVRARQIVSSYELAVDIVQIPRQDLDKILNFCILEKFRQMSSKVRVMGSVLSPHLERLDPDSEKEDRRKG